MPGSGCKIVVCLSKIPNHKLLPVTLPLECEWLNMETSWGIFVMKRCIAYNVQAGAGPINVCANKVSAVKVFEWL